MFMWRIEAAALSKRKCIMRRCSWERTT